MSYDYHLRVGDLDTITADLASDVDGVYTPVVTSAGTTVRFHMNHQETGVSKVNAAGTVVNTAGRVSYTFVAADTDTVGNYLVEWEVTFPDGRIRTFPNPGHDTLRVSPSLG